MSKIEKLEKGIVSLEFRIAALAVRLAEAKTSDTYGDNPRDIARQINEYGRTLSILRRERNNLWP